MPANHGSIRRQAGTISRRDILRVGGLSVLPLSWRLRSAAAKNNSQQAPTATAKSVIFISLYGGPAHQDTFDLKPEAPGEIRGEFEPIDTSVPGTQICEYLPRLAKTAHLYSLVRSVTHQDRGHGSALYTLLTGWPHRQPNSNPGPATADHPPYGLAMNLFQPPSGPVPRYVQVGGVQINGVGQKGGFLGSNRGPFLIQKDASDPEFEVPALKLPNDVPTVRLDHRRQLLTRLEKPSTGLWNGDQKAGRFSVQKRRAFEMLSTSRVRQAFEIDQESASTREQYGHHSVGQNLLLARRLVEAGVPMTLVSWNRGGTWDTHGNNFNSLKGSLLPLMDQGVSALLADLDTRGLLESTLVVACGEFGRTPKINVQAGRDHWSGCYTALLAGGGVQRGLVYGSSDKSAAYPKTNPVGPWDIGATMLHCAGIDPRGEFLDPQDRPRRICQGQPIEGLL